MRIRFKFKRLASQLVVMETGWLRNFLSHPSWLSPRDKETNFFSWCQNCTCLPKLCTPSIKQDDRPRLKLLCSDHAMFETTLPLEWNGGGTVIVVSLLPPTLYNKQDQAGTRIVIIVIYLASYCQHEFLLASYFSLLRGSQVPQLELQAQGLLQVYLMLCMSVQLLQLTCNKVVNGQYRQGSWNHILLGYIYCMNATLHMLLSCKLK